MSYFWDTECAYVLLAGESLIVGFTKQSDHEVTIRDLKREGNVLVRMPRQRFFIEWPSKSHCDRLGSFGLASLRRRSGGTP